MLIPVTKPFVWTAIVELQADTITISSHQGEEAGPFPAKAYLRELIETAVDPDHQAAFADLLTEEHLFSLFEDRDSREMEFLAVSDEGPVWMRLDMDVLSRDEKNIPTRFVLAVRDIDTLKKEKLAEEAKEAEREILINQAFENSNILKFIYYVKEGYGDASQGITDLHGAPRRLDHMPESFRDQFVHPDSYAVHDEMYKRCLEGNSHVSAEIQDINGHWTKVTLEIIEREEDGSPSVIMGIVENTDELHKARSEAAIMQEVCQFAISNRYEEAVLIDTIGNTVHSMLSNDKVSAQSVFHREDNVPYEETLDYLIFHHAEKEADRKLLETLHLSNLVEELKQNNEYDMRCRIIGKDGNASWKLFECISYKGDESKIIMLITDVQQEEDQKEELREAALVAQEANQAKSTFLANMSHEIRTPMNAIVGISEILLGKELPEDVRMDIATIQNSGSSLLGIINDILDFSKIETGRFEINEVEYMLPSVLMDVSNVISVRLAGRPVYFMMDIDPNIPNHFIGDDIRIKQILLNLVGNSMKFTHEGYIELRAEGHFTQEHEYELVFEVRDSGIGIQKKDMDKLFKIFSQVDTKKNRSISGSGLGLSISRNLARMMGGDLTVHSEYGRGSIFTVKILQKVTRYEKIGEVRRKNSVRMLICEQNEAIIHTLRRTMEKLELDYEVCRDPNHVRSFDGMTHVLIRRKAFGGLREKLEFMFPQSNIYLILDNDEHAEGPYMSYKQLQLPLICMQLINALNGEEIVSSIRKKTFDRSSIIPLTFARVLVVDDNATNLQVAEGLMAPYHMKIDTATSGFKAIELAKAIHYDAIFMDHMMPEMDGIEAAQYIRNLPGEYYKKLPIIALTANAMTDARQMFLDAGMNDFVAKPIEMTELNRVLKKYVQVNAPEGYLKKVVAQQQNDKKKPDAPQRPGSGSMQVGQMTAPMQAGQLTVPFIGAGNYNMAPLMPMAPIPAGPGVPGFPMGDIHLNSSAGMDGMGMNAAGMDGMGMNAAGMDGMSMNVPGMNAMSMNVTGMNGAGNPAQNLAAITGSASGCANPLSALIWQNNQLLSQNTVILNQLMQAIGGMQMASYDDHAKNDNFDGSNMFGSRGNHADRAANASNAGEPGADVYNGCGTGNGSPSSNKLDRLNELETSNGRPETEFSASAQSSDDFQPSDQENYVPSDLCDHISGVDMQKSLETYGSVSIYHSILKTYYADLCQKESELQRLYDARDGEGLTICVHALKSASRGAGANELADLAYDMEKAGHSDDWLFIEEHFPQLMEEVRRMTGNVGTYVRKYLSDAPAKEAEQSETFDPEIMTQIREASSDMDYMKVEELLKELSQRVYPPRQMDLLRQMTDACSSYDYEKLDQLISEI